MDIKKFLSGLKMTFPKLAPKRLRPASVPKIVTGATVKAAGSRSVGFRIGIGFAVMVSLILILGGSSLYFLNASSKNLQNIRVANERLILAMQIQNSFTEGSANATKFIAYGDEKHYKQVEKALSDAVVVEYQFADLVAEEKKQDIQKLIQSTAKYSDIIMNDLPALVRSYHRELAAGNAVQAQMIKQDVTRIAERLTPVGEQASSILQTLVQENRDIVDGSIRFSRQDADRAHLTSIIVCLLAAIVGTALSFLLARMVLRPLRLMLAGANEFSLGDLRESIALTSKDEFGELALALNKMREAFRTIVASISVSSEQVASSSVELAAIADRSAQAADQIAGSVTAVAGDAGKQIETVHQTIAAVEQMSTGIRQVAVNADKVAGISKQAADAARSGGGAVGTVTAQMNNIEDVVFRSSEIIAKLEAHSGEIGQIIDTITGIAGQTNLLALNAAIEAARAGEQGRGFAVVAEEVRKLAQQSQEAAQQIAELIRIIQMDTESAVTAMRQGTNEVRIGTRVVTEAGEAFEQISALITEVSDQVGEISASIHQMAGGSSFIVEAIKAVDEVSMDITRQTQMISAATQEETASMQELAGAGHTLSQMAGELKQAVNRFQI
jgi:methyl-accepting chemotaxis protein